MLARAEDFGVGVVLVDADFEGELGGLMISRPGCGALVGDDGDLVVVGRGLIDDGQLGVADVLGVVGGFAGAEGDLAFDGPVGGEQLAGQEEDQGKVGEEDPRASSSA